MAFSEDEQQVLVEMMKERISALQGPTLKNELTRFREASEADLRAAIKAYAQTRLGQIGSSLAARQAEIAELEGIKVLYEAALSVQADGTAGAA